MKFVLVWQLCSLLSQTCIPPYTDRNEFNLYVDCAIAGAEKVIEVANKDKKTFDEQRLMVRYWCNEDNLNKPTASNIIE